MPAHAVWTAERAPAFRALGVLVIAVLTSAHVGSPDVFYSGKAGAYDISVVVQPPEVVPGVARVMVTTPSAVTSVSIRPVYWRAGSKGAPSADVISRVPGSNSFSGSLWLMARGAYTVEVSVQGPAGTGSVMVPVASVATGRLALNTPLAALLVVLGAFLVTGLVNIVRKAAGESLLDAGMSLGDAGVRTTRIAGGVAVVVLAVVVFAGARWWNAVDRGYDRTIYRPAPLALSLAGTTLHVAASDTLYMPTGRAATYVPDHGKLMHLFIIGAKGFAHLHPRPDSAAIPAFTAAVPPVPAGAYRVYADVVQETGFERTLVGSLQLAEAAPSRWSRTDPDDAWFVGEPAASNSMRLADGSIMSLDRPATPAAGEPVTLGVTMADAAGNPLSVEPYLGMAGHAVVARTDGEVYVHLHPMGTVTMAAQDVFMARDRGDTTAAGAPRLQDHAAHPVSAPAQLAGSVSFPYAFPRAGDYRVYVQVKRGGRVLTGAFAITVADAPARK